MTHSFWSYSTSSNTHLQA